MNKLILKDGTILEFSKIEGLNISFTDKTIEELEKVLTKENCNKIQLVTESEEVYGIFNNLECTSITKNLDGSTVIVHLRQIDDLKIKVEHLQSTVEDLVLNIL